MRASSGIVIAIVLNFPLFIGGPSQDSRFHRREIAADQGVAWSRADHDARYIAGDRQGSAQIADSTYVTGYDGGDRGVDILGSFFFRFCGW
jgi:hypothetical protein